MGLFKCIFIDRERVYVIHVSDNGVRVLLPVFMVLSYTLRISYVVRCFGGNLDLLIQKSGPLKWLLSKSFKSSKLVFVETAYLKRFIESKYGIKSRQHPNSRIGPLIYTDEKLVKIRHEQGNFLYIGHVAKSKGILEMIKIWELNYGKALFRKLVVAGPLVDINEEALNKIDGVSYIGSISHSEIGSLINSSFCSILYSSHYGEGYPGSIIESLSYGVPSILSNHRALPDLVLNEEFLVKDFDQFELAVCRLSSLGFADYFEMALLTMEKFKRFNSDIVENEFLDICEAF
jgi:glycosyltransferase involved in cell wall biosynthesis